MNKLYMWIRYEDSGWTLEKTNPIVFVDDDGQTKLDYDYLEEVQNDWYDQIGSKIPNFDWDNYDMGFDLLLDFPETFGGIE